MHRLSWEIGILLLYLDDIWDKKGENHYENLRGGDIQARRLVGRNVDGTVDDMGDMAFQENGIMNKVSQMWNNMTTATAST
jgi:hypothetical protein